jgi:hypothetical protein
MGAAHWESGSPTYRSTSRSAPVFVTHINLGGLRSFNRAAVASASRLEPPPSRQTKVAMRSPLPLFVGIAIPIIRLIALFMH